jgi:hypothetical protein
MSNKELLPCPFCGGEARKEFNNCKMEYEVFCSCCDAVVSDAFEIRAEEKWNARCYPLDKLEDVAFLSEFQDFVKFCRNASAKDECIKELGERLMYFADKIRTNDESES